MSLQPAAVHAHLAELLREEASLLTELERLLEQEIQVLRSGDTDDIERVGLSRQTCTAALTRLAHERADSCRLLAPAAGLQRQWQANLAHARSLRDLNERNGALVAVKLNHVQTLLATLRGSQIEPDYNPQAARHSLLNSRELGSA
jgi:flagellar biosynthesis/type III secretory pathway chaperone